nr:HipA domain-containing protein [uncultured Cupriavidus sp.]
MYEQLGEGRNYGRIEFAYSLMAKAAGITMSECHLLEEDRAHFMTRRFDRAGNERHHMQTLRAMAHLDFNQFAYITGAGWRRTGGNASADEQIVRQY